ncbi:hypothetical protein COCOBI_08-3560 [Coccomyxa sp. Obi]|nr:hypothetical protein COCOBI_08-3560 [Coccomyxa sp. Obi]
MGFAVFYPYIGDYILWQRPSAVVVETAISPEHGAASGNFFTCSHLAQDSNFFERLFCQVSSQLAQTPDPTATRLWQGGLGYSYKNAAIAVGAGAHHHEPSY